MNWNQYKTWVESQLLRQKDFEKSRLIFWRNRLFVNIVSFLLPASLFVLIPGIITSSILGMGRFAFLQAGVLILFFTVIFSRPLGIEVKKAVVLGCLYVLSISSLVFTGNTGIELVYLYSLAVFASLVFPVLVGYVIVLINAFITFSFSLFIHYGRSGNTAGHFNISNWIGVTAVLAILSFLTVSCLHLLFAGLHNKILKEKRLLKDIMATEAIYKQLFNNNPLPMFIYSRVDYRVLLVNEEAVKTYGYSADEFCQLTIFDLRTKEEADKLRAEMKRNGSRGYSRSAGWFHITKAGQLLEVEVQSDNFNYDGVPARIVTITNVSELNAANRLIREQSILLKTIASNFPNGTVAVIDSNYQIKFADGQELAKVNLSAEDLVGKNYLELFPPDKQQALIDFLSPVFDGIPNSIELESRGEIYFRSAVSISPENEEKTVVIASQNVTEQRLKERSISLLETAILNSDEGLAVYNLPADEYELPTFSYVNAAFEKIAGYTLDELVGRSPEILLSPESSLTQLNELKKAIELRSETALEFRGQRKNGAEYYCSFHIIPVIDTRGEVTSFISLHNDITANRHLQNERLALIERLGKSEGNLSSLINNTEDLIWSIDRNLNVIAFNEAFEAMARHFNYQPEVGKYVLPPGFPSNDETVWTGLYRRTLEGEKFSTDIEMLVPSGLRYIGNVSFNPIVDNDGQIAGVGCFLKDITQRRIFEDKIQLQNEKLKEIAFATSHLLRAPLTNILGLANIIDLHNFSNPQNKVLIEYIYSSTLKVDQVIRDIVEQTVLFGSDEVGTSLRGTNKQPKSTG